MKRFWKDLKKHNGYALYAAEAELKAEVASSYLNWIWWILEPLCFMLIYTFIFGYVFNAKEDYFSIFVFIGLTFWNFYNRCLKNSVTMVKKNKAIVSKVYVPKFILILSKMYVNGFKMLINMGIIVIMYFIMRVPFTWNIFYAVPLIVILWIFTFGSCCIMLHLGVFIEDMANVTEIVLKIVFYFTGIFYDIEKRLGKNYPELAIIVGEWNPMAFLIISCRKAILYGQTPSRKIILFWFFASGLLSVIGVRLIYKNENNYVKVI